MKVAIMQPYFFPYIGYFQLINIVDRFILLDGVQYIQQGWINRNRILKPVNDGFSYITIPLVKHSSKANIKDVHAVAQTEWKEKIIRQFDHYKKKAPLYSPVISLLNCCFSTSETSITKLNALFLSIACDYLGVDFKMEIESEMGFNYSEVNNSSDRLIKICEQVGASEYINPIGGRSLYDKETFAMKNIKLNFLQANPIEYNQGRTCFEPGLSILDVMMFNSPADIKLMLKEYQLL